MSEGEFALVGGASQLLPFVIALFVSLSLSKVLNYTIKKIARRFADKTKTILDDLIVDAMDLPLTIWLTGLGIYIAAYFSGLTALPIVELLVKEFVIVAMAITVFKLLNAFLHWYVVEIAPKKNLSLGGIESTIRRVGTLVIIAITLIMMLDSAGIEVSPLIASLGIAGLAVALAFQDTLGNFFAGIHISIDRPIKEGDYIMLETGHEGHVVKIGWRSTQIRQTANNIIVVPNSKLAANIITNYNSPDKSTRVLVPVSVSYDSDLEKVERVATEVAKDVQQSAEGAHKDHVPYIRYTAFGDSGITFNVVLWARDYTERFAITHEFIKKLHRRFRQEGIEIPYPKRDIYIKQNALLNSNKIRGIKKAGK